RDAQRILELEHEVRLGGPRRTDQQQRLLGDGGNQHQVNQLLLGDEKAAQRDAEVIELLPQLFRFLGQLGLCPVFAHGWGPILASSGAWCFRSLCANIKVRSGATQGEWGGSRSWRATLSPSVMGRGTITGSKRSSSTPTTTANSTGATAV